MNTPQPPKWELPDSEKSFADLMREAAGGRKAGLHTGLPSWLRKTPQIENPLLRDLIAFATERQRPATWRFTFAMYVYLLAATAFLGMLLIISTNRPFSLVWLGPWLVALAAVCWALEYDYRRYGSLIRDQLRSSGVLEKLLLGERELAQIYDWTPRFWSLLYLGPRPRDFKGWLSVLVRNLDWYIGEPRPLFRLSWVLVTLFIAAIIIFFTVAIYSLATTDRLGHPGAWYAFVYFVLLGTMVHAHRRSSVGLAVFREFLRERFAEDVRAAEEED